MATSESNSSSHSPPSHEGPLASQENPSRAIGATRNGVLVAAPEGRVLGSERATEKSFSARKCLQHRLKQAFSSTNNQHRKNRTMNITVSWPFGNFEVSAQADIALTEPVNALTKSILEKGFLQLLQRVPASKAEKALAGYEKRPEGFKRDSIPWSDDNALKLIEAFGTEVEVEKATDKAPAVVLPFTITNVVEHEGGEAGTSRKRATEMAAQVMAEPALKLALGLKEDATVEEVVESCHARFFAKKAKV